MSQGYISSAISKSTRILSKLGFSESLDHCTSDKFNICFHPPSLIRVREGEEEKHLTCFLRFKIGLDLLMVAPFGIAGFSDVINNELNKFGVWQMNSGAIL